MMNRLQATGDRRQNGRGGATLTEVLMSLLIMSVGVVSVVSLFPLSILRALQANQLTNGKFAEQNATEIVTAFPGILYGNVPRWTPGGSYTPVPTGERHTPGGTGDVVIAPTPLGSHVPAAGKWFVCRDNSFGAATPPMTAGYVDPDWQHPVALGADFDGDGFQDYGVYDANPDIVWQVDTRARVIDPYGVAFVETLYETTFGNVGFAVPSTPLTAADPIVRIDPTGGSLAQTDALFSLPDSWVVDLEVVPATFTAPDGASTTPGSVTLPSGGELPFDPAATPFGSVRITLVNLNGTEVVSRLVNTVASNTTYLEFNWPDLPASFDQDASGTIDYDDIGSVRVEHFERRYTWLYTVSAAEANEQPRVTCVVFFNRGFSLDDEFLFGANFGNLAAADVDTSGNPDGDVDEDGTVDFAASNQVRVWYGTDPEPPIKAGSFIFDGRAGHWYQIQSIDYLDESAATHTAVLSLSDPVYVLTPTAGPAGRAMLMRGIVHVFDLEL